MGKKSIFNKEVIDNSLAEQKESRGSGLEGTSVPVNTTLCSQSLS